MAKFNFILVLFLVFIHFFAFGQKKKIQAQFTSENIIINGLIDENAWENAPKATNFIMYEPDNGKPIPDENNTEVKLLYDNNAIYVLATLYDKEPGKISRELTNRDEIGVADNFSVFINGNNDGQQDFRFYVSAAGVQMDCSATEENEDFGWDAIWDSKVRFTDFGWVVEMKIPYAALRFPKAAIQTWGVNFRRDIKRGVQNQVYTWNFIDTKIQSVLNQSGTIEGIENIKTPTRLFFIPYSSAYYQKDAINSDSTFKFGMDIKYGINDAFTLDAILIPDFGQAKFDNSILNLEPFEQQFDENRAFFTEAADLFLKGNLFYSRRIGGRPTVSPNLNQNDEIIEIYNTTDLLNATKISGRTDKGLGIGFLNAVTASSFATIYNSENDTSRKEVIEPLVNYNILVFDQRFNQNSSITFVNANTIRNGKFRDANVSAFLFDLNTKANTYNLQGNFKYSIIKNSDYINDEKFGSRFGLSNYNGFKTGLTFEKTSGKYRCLLNGTYLSKYYDPNDLGIIFVNNYHSFYGEMTYRIIHPNKTFNAFKFTQESNIEIENTTNKIQESWYKAFINATTLKNHYIEGMIQFSITDRYDFYEPRVYGKYVYVPKSLTLYALFHSNLNNPFQYEIEVAIEKYDEDNRGIYKLFGGLKYIFNDKLSLSYNFQYTRKVNDRGWVDFDNDEIIFGQRNQEILDHYITGKYALSNKMAFNFISRYYWAYAENNKFLTLKEDGFLTTKSFYSNNKNINFNSWNFDFSYSWWFAPGSEISLLYRNNVLESNRIIQKKIFTNLNNIFDTNLASNISLRLRYYIDYNTLKRKKIN